MVMEISSSVSMAYTAALKCENCCEVRQKQQADV